MTDAVTLGGRLRVARTRRHISLQLAARLAGKAPSTIGQYERDEIKPDVATLVILAERYGVAVDWLVWGEQRPPMRDNDDAAPKPGGNGSTPDEGGNGGQPR